MKTNVNILKRSRNNHQTRTKSWMNKGKLTQNYMADMIVTPQKYARTLRVKSNEGLSPSGGNSTQDCTLTNKKVKLTEYQRKIAFLTGNDHQNATVMRVKEPTTFNIDISSERSRAQPESHEMSGKGSSRMEVRYYKDHLISNIFEHQLALAEKLELAQKANRAYLQVTFSMSNVLCLGILHLAEK